MYIEVHEDSDHHDYLAGGGSGFLLGDGRPDYRREQVVKVYYEAKVNKYITLTPDFQSIRNSEYSAGHGPARVYGIRAHLEI